MKTINYKYKDINLDIKFSVDENTIWMNQNEIGNLFNKSKKTISEHINKIVQNSSSVRRDRTVASNGKTYEMSYFNLDVIEQVGNKIDPTFTKQFVNWCKEQLDKEMSQLIPIQSNIIRFEQDNVVIDVTVEPTEDTVYLSKDQIVMLFDTTRQTVEYHIENIYESCELDKGATCKEILQVQTEGSRQVTRTYIIYNLDLVLSIGFRINSKRGIIFRNWARKVLKNYSIKGYAINENRIATIEANYTYFRKDFEEMRLTVANLKEKLDKKENVKSIYYNGEIFDAYDYLCNLVRKANKYIFIIDPYVDETVLSILKNKLDEVKVNIITTSKCDLTDIDIDKYRLQYKDISITKTNNFHDRFIIIDNKELYVLGSSINRIGYHVSTIIKLEDKMFIEYLNKVYMGVN